MEELRPLTPPGDRQLAPDETDLGRLAGLLQAHAPFDGSHPLRRPGVSAVRASRVNAELFHGVYKPSLCIVAQGAKSLFLGRDVYEYDASRLLMCSVELPVASQVTQASPARPFLCLKLDLDPVRVSELAFRVFPHGLPPPRDQRGVAVGAASAGIVDAATRLVAQLADPREADLLAPLAVDEILTRLLLSPLGRRAAQIGQAGSNLQRVARAVDWVRDHFDQPIKVEALAELVHLGPSAFHQHFKAVTSLSPLQFQKELRLREARRLMLTSPMDATTASRQVGYVSASQFSREYGRLFGQAPSRDIARLREQGGPQPSLN